MPNHKFPPQIIQDHYGVVITQGVISANLFYQDCLFAANAKDTGKLKKKIKTDNLTIKQLLK